MSTLLVDSGYPALPFLLNGHGIDSNRSVTIISGCQASVSSSATLGGADGTELPAGTILSESGTSGKYRPYVAGDTAKGILYAAIDPSHGDVLAAMYVHGVVRSGSLITNSGTHATTRGVATAQLEDQIQFV